ncbi:MAG: cystathionine beta-lyase [Parvularculaceae bacterium]
MKEDTKLISAGRPHRRPHHAVNQPVERASTFLFPTYDDFVDGAKNIVYGRLGTSTHRALEEAVNVLEAGHETRLAPSGLAAVNYALLAFCRAGDQVLVTDSVYDPVRKFCDNFLARFGVETVYYDPLIGEDISALLSSRTKAVLVETPGSLTFEVQDLGAISAAAHKVGARVIVDNTWAAGCVFKPIKHGADVSVQAGTKYLAGHADLLIGTMTSADEASARAVFQTLLQLGSNVSADDAYLALRGLRTLKTRMARHEETGMKLAKWLGKRAEVERVLHPAFKSCPGHATWKRDFSGASGLFSVVMKPLRPAQIKAYFNALKIFGIGYSWGGFESLCVHVKPEKARTAEPWQETGPVFRFSAGLEDADDLIADIDRAFTAMAGAK